MENKTYNGWTNYETWCCNLWLDNDGMSNEIAEWAKEAIENAIERDKSDIRTSARIELEDRIKEFIDERAEKWVRDHMFADLLNGALREIDYRDIASHYIDDIKLFSAGWNLPGYMPDSDPAIFTSFEDAKAYIVEEIKRDAEQTVEAMELGVVTDTEATDESATPEHDSALLTLATTQEPFSAHVGNYVYWVVEV